MFLFVFIVPKNFVFAFQFQGTASVVLAGLVSAQKLTNSPLAEHTFLFLGAGEVRINFWNHSIILYTQCFLMSSCLVVAGWNWNSRTHSSLYVKTGRRNTKLYIRGNLRVAVNLLHLSSADECFGRGKPQENLAC